MATVNVTLHGGPRNGERATIEVDDVKNPPEVYTARVHGPHEVTRRFEYRRARWEPDGPDGGTWIYEA
ncbi:MAG: hypothetical protein FWJ93_13785 [Micromonosporaceae bacterium]